MERWEAVSRAFLQEWPSRRHVTGAVVCGSHVTGNPGPRADVDLVLVLSPALEWRERGNRVIDGLMVEYFANPPAQVRRYMADDHAGNRPLTATMLATGHVLFDHEGEVGSLTREARRWLRKPYPRPGRHEVPRLRYVVWTHVDDVLDASERGARDLAFQYHNALAGVYGAYARFLRQPIIQADRIDRVYGSRRRPLPYGTPEFPDAGFIRALLSAQREDDPARMAARLERVAKIALEGMGGFEIDGWRFRSPVE